MIYLCASFDLESDDKDTKILNRNKDGRDFNEAR